MHNLISQSLGKKGVQHPMLQCKDVEDYIDGMATTRDYCSRLSGIYEGFCQ